MPTYDNTLRLEDEPQAPASGLSLRDVLFMLFRHKGKILLFALAGLLAAAFVFFGQPPVYKSEAKLLVRYVLENSAIDQVNSQLRMPSSSTGDTVINSEVEILTSADLARQVAEAIGPERLAPGATGQAALTAATRSIQAGLEAIGLRGSNIIRVSYKSGDPVLSQRVLEELINRYLVKHLEVHRSLGAFDSVAQEADQLRARLRQTEDDLMRLKESAGIASITSLADSMANMNAEIQRSREGLLAAEAELAGQQARIAEIEKWLDGDEQKRQPNPETGGGKEDGARYQALSARLAQMRQAELELLSKYTPDNPQVRLAQQEIARLEGQRRSLEERFPDIAGTLQDATSMQRLRLELITERAKASALEARIAALKAERAKVEGRAAEQSETRMQIAQLERKKQIEEANYKYYQESLERARIDETLNPAKIPNINVVQRPSAATRVTSDLNKVLLGLAGGGLAFGLGLALLIELLLNRSVKRPADLESKLGIPLIFSIPLLQTGPRSLRLGWGKRNRSMTELQPIGPDDSAPWAAGHFIRPFAEAIRDRLVLYFQTHHLTHKPKLVAVTGISGEEGASTLAASLAAALSETGDGKVLHVDMNVRQPAAHPFLGGRRATSLTEVLEFGHEAALRPNDKNLYLASARNGHNGTSSPMIPKRFYDLLPRLKASDFDYIIFDMPTLEEGSVTLAMAGSMDKVLLVVEAEKSTRDDVQRHYADLSAAHANVSCVLNKTRSYGPKSLEREA